MYPFLRASRVFGRALTTRLNPALRPSLIVMRVWPNDLDTNAHMNNGRYLTLMDLGRFDLMTQCGLVGVVLRQRWFPIAGGVMVRFERPLHAFEKITLKSSILGWDDKWLYFRHDILTGNTRSHDPRPIQNPWAICTHCRLAGCHELRRCTHASAR